MSSVVVITADELRALIREEVERAIGAAAEQKVALLDRSELAAELNVSESTIDRWRKIGKLRPSLMLGESPRWKLEDALEQLKGAA